jgi:hypothetical protein
MLTFSTALQQATQPLQTKISEYISSSPVQLRKPEAHCVIAQTQGRLDALFLCLLHKLILKFIAAITPSGLSRLGVLRRHQTVFP